MCQVNGIIVIIHISQSKTNKAKARLDNMLRATRQLWIRGYVSFVDILWNTNWVRHVDQAILSEDERLVIIRFGRDADRDCRFMDELLYKVAEKVKNFAAIYLCDIDEVPDFNQMYELYDPMTIMFFFRNKHMMCDFGTGNNNKLNFLLDEQQELIDIIEVIYRGARKGKGLVTSPRDYSSIQKRH